MPPQAPHGPRQTHTQLKPRVDLRAQPNATVLMKPPRLPGRSRPHPRPVFAALRTEAEGPPRCRALATASLRKASGSGPPQPSLVLG